MIVRQPASVMLMLSLMRPRAVAVAEGGGPGWRLGWRPSPATWILGRPWHHHHMVVEASGFASKAVRCTRDPRARSSGWVMERLEDTAEHQDAAVRSVAGVVARVCVCAC